MAGRTPPRRDLGERNRYSQPEFWCLEHLTKGLHRADEPWGTERHAVPVWICLEWQKGFCTTSQSWPCGPPKRNKDKVTRFRQLRPSATSSVLGITRLYFVTPSCRLPNPISLFAFISAAKGSLARVSDGPPSLLLPRWATSASSLAVPVWSIVVHSDSECFPWVDPRRPTHQARPGNKTGPASVHQGCVQWQNSSQCGVYKCDRCGQPRPKGALQVGKWGRGPEDENKTSYNVNIWM